MKVRTAATDSDLHPVMILAGGTGGHIFPGLAVAGALRALDVPVLWLGADGGMETRLVPQHGIAIDTIAVRGVRGKGIATLLGAPVKLLSALRAARQILRERRLRMAPVRAQLRCPRRRRARHGCRRRAGEPRGDARRDRVRS